MRCQCRRGPHSSSTSRCPREATLLVRRKRTFIFWYWYAIYHVCDLCYFSDKEIVAEELAHRNRMPVRRPSACST